MHTRCGVYKRSALAGAPLPLLRPPRTGTLHQDCSKCEAYAVRKARPQHALQRRGRKARLHAADFEPKRGLGGRSVLQLAALNVRRVAVGVPRAEADLDVADGRAPVVPRHILQRHQLPPARLHHTHCAPGRALSGIASQRRPLLYRDLRLLLPGSPALQASTHRSLSFEGTVRQGDCLICARS